MNKTNQKAIKFKFKSKKTADAPTCTIALAGNPNSGKTTLFNLLTGANQKVGNWPGVTVERKTGTYKRDASVTITDTPGIYSLSPFALDEQIALNYLAENPNVIVNVVDSTNLERNLFLTTQLLELGIPLVVALNMKDEADKMGISIDTAKLEESFGCKFFAISATKNQGVDKIMEYCTTLATMPRRKQTPAKQSTDKILAAQERYEKIAAALTKAQTKTPRFSTQRAQNITQKIDKFVLNKWLAFPIFALVMALVFYISIDGIGGFLTNLINERFTPWLQTTVSGWFASINANAVRSLVVDGIIGGVMSVVGFLPQIMLLFGFIAILESSGYMSRIAFITDKLLNNLGLGGRSFVSLVLGCGCSVPAIIATRTIKNTRERNATITLTPFMPCSAKLAVISFFTSYIFGGKALFAISFYFLSIAVVIIGGLVLKTFGGKSVADAFIMELPPYRAPTLRNVAKQMWERGKSFLIKAGTIIFAASVLLWILTNFNLHFEMTDAEHSMLASLGKLIAPIFYPLGWNDGGCGWQFAIATLSGIAAKETVVTTLQILLPQGIGNCISALGAYSFVSYNLLTIPCIAAVSASFAEQKISGGLKSAAFQICTAYVVSLAIYQIGTFAQLHISAFVTTLCCFAIATAVVFAVKYILKTRCNACQNCPQSSKCKKHK